MRKLNLPQVTWLVSDRAAPEPRLQIPFFFFRTMFKARTEWYEVSDQNGRVLGIFFSHEIFDIKPETFFHVRS